MPHPGGRIVRIMSAPSRDTVHVTRAKGRAGRTRRGLPRETASADRSALAPPPTPVLPEELMACAGEVKDLLDELDELSGCGNAWGLRVLRRNVELALASPVTLVSPENQMDFIEELAEAVWDGADSGFRYAVKPADTRADAPGGTRTREERRRDIVERFDRLAHDLCVRVERWHELEAAAADAPLAAPRIFHTDHMV